MLARRGIVGLEDKRVHAPRVPWERVEIRVEVREGSLLFRWPALRGHGQDSAPRSSAGRTGALAKSAARCEPYCDVLRRTRFLPRDDNPWTS